MGSVWIRKPRWIDSSLARRIVSCHFFHDSQGKSHADTKTRQRSSLWQPPLLLPLNNIVLFADQLQSLGIGGSDRGKIKVWNVKEQACVHSIESGGVDIHSLHFAGGNDIACLAAADTGSVMSWDHPASFWEDTRISKSASQLSVDISKVGSSWSAPLTPRRRIV
jgi:hypothetical protein